MRDLVLVAALAVLAGCVTAVGTAYAPADERGYGYQETRIEDDRYRVVFRGDGATPAGVVEDYALRRAAELTLDAGYDWFRVVGRVLESEEKGGVGVGAGVGGGNFGRRSGVSVGVGGDLGTIGARRLYTARLEILLGAGEKPAGDGASGEVEIYDARSVLSYASAPAP